MAQWFEKQVTTVSVSLFLQITCHLTFVRCVWTNMLQELTQSTVVKWTPVTQVNSVSPLNCIQCQCQSWVSFFQFLDFKLPFIEFSLCTSYTLTRLKQVKSVSLTREKERERERERDSVAWETGQHSLGYKISKSSKVIFPIHILKLSLEKIVTNVCQTQRVGK